MPIENLLKDEQSKKFIAKDSYFKLQHLNTKQWLSFKGGELDAQHDRFGKVDETTSAPVLSSIPKEMDTFKMVKANFGEIWEISFLLSAFPIFLEIMDYLSPLVIFTDPLEFKFLSIEGKRKTKQEGCCRDLT